MEVKLHIGHLLPGYEFNRPIQNKLRRMHWRILLLVMCVQNRLFHEIIHLLYEDKHSFRNFALVKLTDPVKPRMEVL